MFKIKWEPDYNGVVLSEYIEEAELINNPRPVYAEELRMLGLNSTFLLPEQNVPVCWEIDRKYYYCGNVIAETKKGNIYEDPIVVVSDEFKGIELKELDVAHIVRVNEKSLSVIENEAMDFIKQKYEEYQKKSEIAGFVVAFSGGKDSQVTLDLVSRVIPHEKFIPVFTNTGMELPCTLELMEITEKYYQKRYPGFKLEQAESNKSALEMAYTKAHLPSITSIAKNYYTFDNEWISEFDEKVNHGGIYYHVDNIEKSLSTIEKIVNHIITSVGDNPFVITADHGGSIGHKISKKEKLYDFEKSEHDGRCYLNREHQIYPSSVDYVAYDSETGKQWIIALNQQSLFNNSKYVVHGGGTPEEVVVPVIFARKEIIVERTYNVKAINLKVSGMQREIEVKITPNPDNIDIRLFAKDGTDKSMNYCEETKSWKGKLERGIEQEITVVVNGKEYKFTTIPSTKMGEDLFDD